MQHTVEQDQEGSLEEVEAEDVDTAGQSPTPKMSRKCRASNTRERTALVDLHENDVVEVDNKQKKRKITDKKNRNQRV